jgi:adenylate kinase
MNIIILGPQGCGKGTQSDLLSKKLGVPTISAGQLLRDEAAKGTPLGRKIKPIIDKGNLVPNSWILGLLLKRIKKCKRGFVLDGYPRNNAQLEDMKKSLKADVVFRINISEKESVKRLMNRRVCNKCEASYNLLTIKPKKSGGCDKCGAALVQRDDDKPAAIKRRLSIYRRDTRVVFDYFSKKGLLLDINGEQDIEKVHEDILKELEKKAWIGKK